MAAVLVVLEKAVVRDLEEEEAVMSPRAGLELGERGEEGESVGER